MALTSTAIAAFASRHEADQAIVALLAAAFRADQLGLVLPASVSANPGLEPASPTATWEGAMFRSLLGVEIPAEEMRYYEEALEKQNLANENVAL